MRYLKPWRNSLTHADFFNDFDKIFDHFLTTSAPELENSEDGKFFRPHVDVKETAEYFLVSADLPGLKPEDIKIEVQDGRLVISGERSYENKEEKEGKLHRFERRYGKFERSFGLPPNIDESKIQARHDNGVLEVLIPRVEIGNTKTVKVEQGTSGLFSKLLSNETKKDVN